ncbi:fanconi-associated nuclease 1-like isoform X2 [Plodia interpunctella]|uniref:fanconi-associated nuclease 1-like isoform X2 n=1 Tax=Plodia interpunctella TaxID=58824 RepID=UPI002367BD13|nr:fanconi-associated nuclease 1-like isoform X2 [Plodia interpunctella]
MSRQATLDTYFKTKHKKSNCSQSMTDSKKKRGKTASNKKFNLSLAKSPTSTKSSKLIKESGKEVIHLTSDDEDFCSPMPTNVREPDLDLSENDANSDSSQDTIPYSLIPEKSAPAFTTPEQKAPTISTPMKTPNPCFTPKSSPGSKTTFYSPIKKRIVMKRTPVKRKLDADFTETKFPLNETNDYAKDDKTKLLINTIRKCLENESLKNLLSEDSQMLLSRCLSVVTPGIRVVCRLYWRKVGWYKTDQVKAMLTDDTQVDDSTFQVMLDSLITNGLVVRGSVEDGNLSFDDLVAILKADELKQICKDLKLKIRSKQGAIGALRSYCRMSSIGNYFIGSSQSNTDRVLRIMTRQAGPCFKLSVAARNTLEKLYLLMYLGINYEIIREKRLEVTILYDKVGLEAYPIDKNMELDDASIVFDNREQFDRYFSAHRIYEDYLEKTDLNEKCNIVKKVYSMYKDMSEGEMLCYKALPIWLRRYTPAHIYVKILEVGVVELKKHKTKEQYTLAVDILTSLINQVWFRQHKKSDWYSEKALILYNLELYDEAAMVLLEGVHSLPDAAARTLRMRARRVTSRASAVLRARLLLLHREEDALPAKHVYKHPMDRSNPRGKLMFETRQGAERQIQDAEHYCISHYLQEEDFTHGYHWEGSIITTMFFLLFWDVIYKKPRGVRGIFLTPYQRYPLDMFCESFYTNRQTDIEERLAFIEMCTTEEMLDIMSRQWNSRCVVGRAMAALSRRLATDYRYSSCGFPDLTLWNIHTGKIKFVEVKTDSDKPSIKQIQWLQFLREIGFEAEFCCVGARRKEPGGAAAEPGGASAVAPPGMGLTT